MNTLSIASILGVAVLALMGLLTVAKMSNDALRAYLVRLILEIDFCKAASINKSDDQASDGKINEIPDRDLRIAPDRWMRKAGSGPR